MAILSSHKLVLPASHPLCQVAGTWVGTHFGGSLSRRPTEPEAEEKGEEACSLTCTCRPQSDHPSMWPCPLHRWSQATLWVTVIILLTLHLIPGQRARERNTPYPCPVLRSAYVLGGTNACSQPLRRRAIQLGPLCQEPLDGSGAVVRGSLHGHTSAFAHLVFRHF